MTSSHPARRDDDDDFTFSTAAWVAIDVLALFVLVLMLWVFQPEKGILPEPSWLIDPLAGWLLGNVVGFAAYKAFLRMPPAGTAALCLVLVALSPVIFVKYPAMGAFFSALVIGLGAGSLIHRTLAARQAR